MIYLAYISIFFVGLQLFNVVINFLFRQKIIPSNEEEKDLISVLIPARNEEKNIGVLLADLQKIKHNNTKIIVFDDQSTDDTGKIVEAFAKKDQRIKLLTSKGLPDGWLGKNYACFNLAKNAKGKYYLFLDADVRVNGSLIVDTVKYMKKYKLGLLSIFPTQIQKTLGEKITVPIMNYILLSLLPLIFVRISPFKSHAAANGQFMLFDADIYKEKQPHFEFKKFAVEDIAIARFYKRQKIKTACIAGEQRIKCRMYRSYKEALNGFSKNVFMFFGNVPILAFSFWLLAALGFIPVLISVPDLLAFYVLAIVAIQFFYAIVANQNILQTILLFPFHLGFLLILLGKALIVKTKNKHIWKERDIFS